MWVMIIVPSIMCAPCISQDSPQCRWKSLQCVARAAQRTPPLAGPGQLLCQTELSPTCLMETIVIRSRPLCTSSNLLCCVLSKLNRKSRNFRDLHAENMVTPVGTQQSRWSSYFLVRVTVQKHPLSRRSSDGYSCNGQCSSQEPRLPVTRPFTRLSHFEPVMSQSFGPIVFNSSQNVCARINQLLAWRPRQRNCRAARRSWFLGPHKNVVDVEMVASSSTNKPMGRNSFV